jgi:hypothetical protein
MELRREADLRERFIDEEHLRLLALFHYISGGMTLAFSLFFAVMTGFMMVMLSAIPMPEMPQGKPPPAPPVEMFWFFAVFASLGVLFGVLEIIAGRCISLRRARVFTLIAALPGVIFIPYGTLLSVFTLLVLDRGSVKQLYQERPA